MAPADFRGARLDLRDGLARGSPDPAPLEVEGSLNEASVEAVDLSQTALGTGVSALWRGL